MFHEYPYTNMHELNLDWLIATVKKVEGEVDDFVAYNKITFAGTWDPSNTYPAWSVVEDGAGDGYVSIKPVPTNVPLSDVNYWIQVASYTSMYTAFNSRISALESVTINGYALSGAITLPYVPNSRTVNGKQLNADRTIAAEDVPFDPANVSISSTDVQGAIEELSDQLTTVALKKTAISANSNRTLQLGNNTHGFILYTGSGSNSKGIQSYNVSTGGTVTQAYNPFGSTTPANTFTTGLNSLNIRNEASTVVYLIFILYNGPASVTIGAEQPNV